MPVTNGSPHVGSAIEILHAGTTHDQADQKAERVGEDGTCAP